MTPEQMHLDLAVDDLATAGRTASEPGAARAEHQPAPDRLLVMLDPAGHQFCPTTRIP